MQKQEVQKHFLALLRRPGDYSLVPITKLDIADSYSYDSLMDIDAWTMKYTKEEIVASIIRANIVSSEYISGELVIQDNQKHNPLPVIDKEYYNNFKIDEFLHNSMSDKNRINTIINKYNALFDENNELFSKALRNGSVNMALDLLFMMPYLNIRKFIIYLIELRNKDLEIAKNKELVRDKAA